MYIHIHIPVPCTIKHAHMIMRVRVYVSVCVYVCVNALIYLHNMTCVFNSKIYASAAIKKSFHIYKTTTISLILR